MTDQTCAEEARVLARTAPHEREGAITAALRARHERGRQEAAEIVTTEPEPDGEMPPELHNVPAEDIARAAVRATKGAIFQRIAALPEVT